MSQRGGRCTIAPLLRGHSLICLSQTSLINKLAAVELSAGERKHFGLFQLRYFRVNLGGLDPARGSEYASGWPGFETRASFSAVKPTQNVLVIAAVAKG